ncbi:hypothetical protein B0H14DRAFT_2753438, partial [Mycena olivaceomarginata]
MFAVPLSPLSPARTTCARPSFTRPHARSPVQDASALDVSSSSAAFRSLLIPFLFSISHRLARTGSATPSPFPPSPLTRDSIAVVAADDDARKGGCDEMTNFVTPRYPRLIQDTAMTRIRASLPPHSLCLPPNSRPRRRPEVSNYMRLQGNSERRTFSAPFPTFVRQTAAYLRMAQRIPSPRRRLGLNSLRCRLVAATAAVDGAKWEPGLRGCFSRGACFYFQFPLSIIALRPSSPIPSCFSFFPFTSSCRLSISFHSFVYLHLSASLVSIFHPSSALRPSLPLYLIYTCTPLV